MSTGQDWSLNRKAFPSMEKYGGSLAHPGCRSPTPIWHAVGRGTDRGPQSRPVTGSIDGSSPAATMRSLHAGACPCAMPYSKRNAPEGVRSVGLVDLRGIEPLTSSMPRKRAPAAPQARSPTIVPERPQPDNAISARTSAAAPAATPPPRPPPDRAPRTPAAARSSPPASCRRAAPPGTAADAIPSGVHVSAP